MLIPSEGAGVDPSLTYNASAGSIITGVQVAQQMGVYDPSVVNLT